MRLTKVIVIVLLLVTNGTATLMLGSLLTALKGGIFAEKMGTGGLLALALAGTQPSQEYGLGIGPGQLSSLGEQDMIGTGTTTMTNTQMRVSTGLTTTTCCSKRRTARSIKKTVGNMPLLVDVTSGSESEPVVLDRIVSSLNNVSSPTTRRMMRQVAILDQLSCLPKVICSMSTRKPSKRTSILNDYGFLIKYLFERDEEDDPEVDDDEDDDDDGTRSGLAKKGATNDKESESVEGYLQDDNNRAEDEANLEEMAQTKLLEDEPELLTYALAELKQRYRNEPRVPGIHKEYGLDHSDVVGYNREDYKIMNSPYLNTDVATQILKDRSKYVIQTGAASSDKQGWNIGTKNVQFQVEPASPEEESSGGGLFGSFLPSFSITKVRSPTKSGGNKGDDPFADDPFFDGFRRSLQLSYSKNKQQFAHQGNTDKLKIQQRLNSRQSSSLNTIDYISRMKAELENTVDPLKKYEIAEEVGRQARSNRQCRMLFAKCPYTNEEINTMMDNVRQVVSTETKGKDNVVELKQNTDTKTNLVDSLGITKAGTLEVPVSSIGGGAGTTSISHQLGNGDKVEVMLKINPKQEEGKVIKVVQVPATPDPELVAANKTLQEMRQALQILAKLRSRPDLQALKKKIQQKAQKSTTEKINGEIAVDEDPSDQDEEEEKITSRGEDSASTSKSSEETVDSSRVPYRNRGTKRRVSTSPPGSLEDYGADEEDENEEVDSDEITPPRINNHSPHDRLKPHRAHEFLQNYGSPPPPGFKRPTPYLMNHHEVPSLRRDSPPPPPRVSKVTRRPLAHLPSSKVSQRSTPKPSRPSSKDPKRKPLKSTSEPTTTSTTSQTSSPTPSILHLPTILPTKPVPYKIVKRQKRKRLPKVVTMADLHSS